MDEKIEQLQKMIDESSRIVFFGGAGVSTESGIPDFRSQDGLYQQKWKYPPETIISRSFFDTNPKEFYRFYRDKLIIKNAKPNITHFKLAELEQKGKTDLLEVVRDISKMINIYYIRQKEPRGLGDAIHCARSFIGDEPFAVMLGDDIVDNDVPCLRQLMDAYEEYRTTILGVQMVEKENVNKYGIIEAKHIEDRVYKVFKR